MTALLDVLAPCYTIQTRVVPKFKEAEMLVVKS
jgi:hypothetical protein